MTCDDDDCCETYSIAVQFFNNKNCKFLENKPKVFMFNILNENKVSENFRTQTSINRQMEEKFLNKDLN